MLQAVLAMSGIPQSSGSRHQPPADRTEAAGNIAEGGVTHLPFKNPLKPPNQPHTPGIFATSAHRLLEGEECEQLQHHALLRQL